ncbi:MAG TPA: exodeoxyribonuclease VII large subunit [Caulobacteraceae bacterium]|nr:exodeoxyribonuclease VII large subunit [Caulobacteraceae bacterium]
MTDVAAPESGQSSNLQAYSVSELAFALKRTIEDAYGFVRVRGELSKVTFHSSGHVYLDIKDERASISGVIWKTNVRGLAIKPQTGMEVVVTGRITTYPGRSQYQIVIETMAPAGVGALLAQLERLKAKLASEGLFEKARKRPLPSMPGTIGVITSPTGAVIRDILHRIRERWPCRVIVWPTVVQGEIASAQVAAAIAGFNRIQPGGRIPRPDVLIVARGGGSVEDLWPFNDEALARAAAASAIPLISAVGHETDTTLIDYVADRRAPTPTAAAEMATPVFTDLAATLADYERRLLSCGGRAIEQRRTRLEAAARGLPRPQELLAIATQRLDIAAGRLTAGLQRNVAVHAQALAGVGGRLGPRLLQREAEQKQRRLVETSARLAPAMTRRLQREDERVTALGKLHESLNPKGPLRRGYALVYKGDGRLARSATELRAGQAVRMEFQDGKRDAIVDAAPGRRPRSVTPGPDQGDLF